MKKLVIAVLTVTAVIAGAAAVSAECRPCANEYCPRGAYCMEECINNCPQNDCKGTHRMMRRAGHHRGYRSVNNEYCPYR